MKFNHVTHQLGGTTAIHIVYKAVPYDCIIDTADYPLVCSYLWHINCSRERLYVQSSRSQGSLSLHRLLKGFPPNEVDHEDGDGLNNRQMNLRMATHRQNCRNRKKKSDGLTSQYKGVYYNQRLNRWITQLDGKHIGCFKTEIEAALKYNAAAKAKHRVFALLNKIGG